MQTRPDMKIEHCPTCGAKLDSNVRGEGVFRCPTHGNISVTAIDHDGHPLTGDDEEEEDVWVVTGRFDDDPHPHVLGVFDTKAPAEQLRKRCATVSKPPHPVAWTVTTEPIRASIADKGESDNSLGTGHKTGDGDT